jgi:sulfane dehydrogenase subunit SoxC
VPWEWLFGVPLRYVLERTGISPAAYHVCLKGSETDSLEGEVKMPMPVEKAMHQDTILALEMNGEPLPADHGFPVRAIVPGWIGTYSVNWIKEIEVTRQHLCVARNTEYYVLMGDEWSAEEFAPVKGPAITEQNIKSSFALRWPAKLSPGEQTIRGYARSSGSVIARASSSGGCG